MLTFRNRLLLSALLAPILTALLYWTDSDPLYTNRWDAIREFAIITVILFGPILGFTWMFRKR